eukprot:TRINITY_DN106829_c0_g1_i1.p1 TRINITY_DN106829_c0_g1~~TRINITY_DN106829_c0_g1_i1.p1  ORF type:complete len:494 (+),score=130.32 TRINITY_DN106829_c0_g1_i1:24-1505(+)
MPDFNPPPRDSGKLAFSSPTLSFEEVKGLVEKAAPKLELKVDEESGSQKKGRYLVARCALKAGEVVLSERPLFSGSTDASRSRHVYSESFLARLQQDDTSELEGEEEEEDFEDDCFHPRSPLVDCVAAVLLAKKLAAEEPKGGACLRLRQFHALHRVSTSASETKECVDDLWGALRPEMQNITSAEELASILQTLSSNRFGNSASTMELMFAGSMFEHSCLPNCFVGTWHDSSAPAENPQTYRAIRDIAQGEALSIDYLALPDGYFPAAERRKALSGWGFECTCPRCTSQPELERSFMCEACGAPELCPQRPGGSAEYLKCLACGKPAEAAYAARCLAREAFLNPDTPEESEEKEGIGSTAKAQEAGDSGLMGPNHYLVFQALWAEVALGPPDSAEDMPPFREAVEALIAAVTRLYNDDCNPLLLDLYHLGALVTQGKLEVQRRFLDREDVVMRRFYPEVAAQQDSEVLALVQRNGPVQENAPQQRDTFDEMD